MLSIGLFHTNKGKVRNIQINLTESTSFPNTNINLMGYMNAATGIVENFVINMQEPIYGANYLFAVLRHNRGTIQNGYIYGKNIEAIYPLAEGQTRYAAIQSQNNYVKGISRNIYTLASVNVLEQEGVTDSVANIVSIIYAGCKIQNIYSVGIGNRTNFNQIGRASCRERV